VLKAVYVYVMASLWIGGWGFFAIDEVNATVTHILEKNGTQISSVLKPGLCNARKKWSKVYDQTRNCRGSRCNYPRYGV
jgi:hypothetical protein